MTLHFFSAAFRPAAELNWRGMDKVPADDAQLHEIVSRAGAVLQTPMAMLTIMEGDVQRMVNTIGIAPVTISRAIAFCSHTLAADDDMLCVPDLRADKRFRANPLVVGEAGMRYYAGACVTALGVRAGALCGIDTRPRPRLSPEQRRALVTLADAASSRIDAILRRTARSPLNHKMVDSIFNP